MCLCLLTPPKVNALVIAPIPFGGFVTAVQPCFSCRDFGCVATMLTVVQPAPLPDVSVVVHNTSILHLFYVLHPATFVLGNGYPDPVCFTPFKDAGKIKWTPIELDIAVFQMGISPIAPL